GEHADIIFKTHPLDRPEQIPLGKTEQQRCQHRQEREHQKPDEVGCEKAVPGKNHPHGNGAVFRTALPPPGARRLHPRPDTAHAATRLLSRGYHVLTPYPPTFQGPCHNPTDEAISYPGLQPAPAARAWPSAPVPAVSPVDLSPVSFSNPKIRAALR